MIPKFGVQIALEGIREARAEWVKSKKEFDARIAYVMKRLINEAAANRLSAEFVAEHSGYTPKQVRAQMRANGLDPKKGKLLLAKQASENLAANAEAMGIAPHEMDLMSPLAYLPMGEELRRKFLETEAVKGVHDMDELSGTDLAEGWWCTNCEFFEDDQQTDTSVDTCTLCGCNGAAHRPVTVVAK